MYNGSTLNKQRGTTYMNLDSININVTDIQVATATFQELDNDAISVLQTALNAVALQRVSTGLKRKHFSEVFNTLYNDYEEVALLADLESLTRSLNPEDVEVAYYLRSWYIKQQRVDGIFHKETETND